VSLTDLEGSRDTEDEAVLALSSDDAGLHTPLSAPAFVCAHLFDVLSFCLNKCIC
jgi:hypothetical protein